MPSPRIKLALAHVAFAAALFACIAASPARAQDEAAADAQPVDYAYAHAVAVLEETNNQGTAYFSLAAGHNNLVYTGPAKYGVNAYLVEVDPNTDKQRIVIDTHALCGIENATGYKAQSKIHTRPYVAPSGVIYLGSKQGYPDKKTNENRWSYPGGYLMSYNPKTDEAVCHAKLPYRNFGVIDAVADESRDVIYFVAQEDNYRQHMWGRYDIKTEQFEVFGPPMALYAATLLDKQGNAYALTKDYQLAMYSPDSDEIVVRDIKLGDDVWNPAKEHEGHVVPTWQIDNEGRYAYLIMMRKPMLYRIDLHQPGDAVQIEALGNLVDAERTDSRSSLDVAPDGRVYVLLKAPAPQTGQNKPLHYLVRYDPKTGQTKNLGITVVRNKDFYHRTLEDGSKNPNARGLIDLPDGNLTFQYVNQGLVVADDGTVYGMLLMPLTVVKFEEK